MGPSKLAKILFLVLGLTTGPGVKAMARANPLCDHAKMAPDYTPPEDVTRTASRLERNTEAGKKLKQELHDLAVREMRAGATVGQLAKHLPWSAETLRGIGRKAGIPLKREPTVVGRKAMQDAVAEALAAQAPSSIPAPATTAPRQQVAQPLPRPKPTSPVQQDGVELTDGQAHHLVAIARKAANSEQRERFRRTEATAVSLGRDVDLAIIDAAFAMGLLTNEDVAEAGTLHAVDGERIAVLAIRARSRADKNELAALEQAAQMTGSTYRDYAVVAKAHAMGLITDPELHGADLEATPTPPAPEES